MVCFNSFIIPALFLVYDYKLKVNAVCKRIFNQFNNLFMLFLFAFCYYETSSQKTGILFMKMIKNISCVSQKISVKTKV